MSNNLVKPKFLFSQCISIVSKYVECHDPLKFESINAIKGVFVLRNTTPSMYKVGDPHFYLLRIKNSENLYLHISTTLKVPYKGASIEVNHEFAGISVQFFHGVENLFCRAEWDVKKEKDKLEHPQPHWHWCFENKTKESPQFENDNDEALQNGDFLQEVEKISEKKLPDINFGELHYAMAAKWTAQDSAIEEFTIQRLRNWLDNCIANVIDQYNYQVNKGSFISSKKW